MMPHRTPAMMDAGEYWILLCGACNHPGGAHVIDQWEPRVTHCQCGNCPTYADEYLGIWSNQRADELRAAS